MASLPIERAAKGSSGFYWCEGQQTHPHTGCACFVQLIWTVLILFQIAFCLISVCKMSTKLRESDTFFTCLRFDYFHSIYNAVKGISQWHYATRSHAAGSHDDYIYTYIYIEYTVPQTNFKVLFRVNRLLVVWPPLPQSSWDNLSSRLLCS